MRTPLDADARLVRAAARRVGITITVAVSVLVLGVLVAALKIVLEQIPLKELLSTRPHETVVDIGGLDILLWGIAVGFVAIILAGTLALFVTRRAVAPLADALGRQRRFVADASHELRTPLAILDARIQQLQRALSADDPHRELVQQLRADSKSLAGVVADLLEAVDATPTGTLEPVSVGVVVDAAVSSMRVIGGDRGVAIEVTAIPDGLNAAIPEASLQRCLVALLDNAVKHSPPGSIVTITTKATGSDVLIDVIDQGGGIRGIAPDRVFDRFARSSDAVDGGGNGRTGFGIGLALVQDTMGRYGGSVAIASTSSAGTTMRLLLPRPGRRGRHA